MCCKRMTNQRHPKSGPRPSPGERSPPRPANGPEIRAFRVLDSSRCSRFVDLEEEIAESLRPCRKFPFCGDYRRRLVRSRLPPQPGTLSTKGGRISTFVTLRPRTRCQTVSTLVNGSPRSRWGRKKVFGRQAGLVKTNKPSAALRDLVGGV